MLNTHISRYVALHRSLGRKYDEQDRLLRLYAAYAGHFGDQHTQVQRIYDWCHTASSPMLWRRPASAPFATSAFSPMPRIRLMKCLLPAFSAGASVHDRPPHIIEPEQIRAIMAAALDPAARHDRLPHAYHCLFGLLAATGLRISEALALQCDDLGEDGLIIRNGKFGKQRLVALQPSTRQALEAYLATRARLGATGNDLFVTIRGQAPHKVRAHIVFVRLARQLGYRGPTGTTGMRMHDLRHTFAVRSLESWSPDRKPWRITWPVSASIWVTLPGRQHLLVSRALPVLLRDIAAASEHLYLGEAA